MSGLEALSVVGNIFQLISFARETIALCRNVYQGRSPDDWLGENAASLAALSAQIQQHYQGKRPQGAAEQQLSLLATRCGIAARSLEEEVGFLTDHKAKGSLAATLRLAVKTNWRKKRLETVERSLGAYQKTLETSLLARVCKQSDAIELAQREAFQELESGLQHFVLQYASGHKTLCELVKEESISSKEHITKESSRAERAVQLHITTKLATAEQSITSHVNIKLEEATQQITSGMQHLRTESVTNAQRERFLRSLKFPSMNERLNQILDSHKGTFKWIFRPRPKTGYGTFDEDMSDSGTSSDGIMSDDEYEVVDNQATNTSVPKPLPQSSKINDVIVGNMANDFSHGVSQGSNKPWEQTDQSLHDLTRGVDGDELWDNFSDWLKSESKLYWISGKPGSGKSTLVKFLLETPLIREALDVWKPNTTILAHFFWKPGSQMQKSLKGLFCSLLHQALAKHQEALDVLLLSSPSLASKDADTDWSLKELMAESLQFFASVSRPSCIFIDGLDEISDEDGATALMKAIDKLKSLPNIKVCVASRLEPRFEKALYDKPRLRLQDLTAEDMKQYATATLRPYIQGRSRSPDLQQPIISELVDRADGVFLWLRLAIQALIRGYENDDDDEILLQRISTLPNELSQLYYDMWTRSNDDTPLYRKSAAQYFNLIIEATEVHDRFMAADRGSYSPYWNNNGSISIFQIMAATNPVVLATRLDENGEVEESRLSQLCEETKTAIKLRCAGLVEIQTDESPTRYEAWAVGQCRGVVPYLGAAVRWIHRSAYDFLRESEYGHELRKHDKSHQEERIMLLIRAQLVQSSIFRAGLYNSIYTVLVPLTWVRNVDSLLPVNKALRVCWRLYSSNYLDYDFRCYGPVAPHFLAVATWTPFRDFVITGVANSRTPSILATIVLREMMHTRWFYRSPEQADKPEYFDSFSDRVACFLEPLLALGADPGKKGCRRAQIPRYGPEPFRPTMFASAFGFFLAESFREPLSCHKHTLELLSTFMATGPDLEDGVPLELVVPEGGKPFLMDSEHGLNENPWNPPTKFTLYANLVCLMRLLYLRASRGTDAQSLAKYSSLEKQLNPISGGALPSSSVRVTVISLRLGDGSFGSYRPLSRDVSPNILALLRLVQVWFGGDEYEGLVDEIWERVSLLQAEINGGTESFVKLNEPIEARLAKEGYGYRQFRAHPIEFFTSDICNR